MPEKVLVNATIKDNKLIIELPVEPRLSKSGKATLVSTTGGFQPSLAVFNGKPVAVAVNATIPLK